MSSRRNRTLVLSAVGACVVVGAVAIWLVGSGGGASAEGSLDAKVRRASVTLSGVVPSQEVKSEIGARAAELVGGPANVTNDIQVDGGVAAGPWLEAAIGGFAGLPVAPRPLRYSVSGGTLTLEGKAASASEKSALIQTVTGLVEGRLKIDDQVVVAS
jgi:osmotically-inducible protein OsmY